MNRFRENLLVQFSVVSFVVMTLIAVVLATVLSDKVRSDATSNLIAEAVDASSGRLLNAITPADLEVPMTGERYDRFHEFVQKFIVSDRTARVKLWGKDGTVIYDENPAKVGKTFPAHEGLRAALRGENFTELKVPEDVEHTGETQLATLMEVYSPAMFPGTTEPQGAFEFYQYYAPTSQLINDLRRWLFGSIGVGFVVLYGGLVFIVWRGWRTMAEQRSQIEAINAELEKRVEERVEELRRANEHLQEEVTRSQQLHEQLTQSAKLATVGTLISGVAHEVNNPLTGALGRVDLLLREDLDDAFRRDIQLIRDETQRAVRVMQNLLSFAREHKPEATYISINEILEATLNLRAYELRVSNVEVKKELQPDLPRTMADGHQLQQVFLNLIINAEQAMTEAHGRGVLSVKTRHADDSIHVTITDDGPGITDENLARIFDPFFSTKPVGKGTGLGLSICYGIVREHGGAIRVVSELGKGTSFTVELPIVPADSATL